jgi:LPXTG-motif cell wall-anchored protein
MSYSPPSENEMIYAVKDDVGLWSSASTTSTRLQTNSQYGDHSLRYYHAGEAMGRVIGKELYPSPGGSEQFIKIQYWTWENRSVGIIGLLRENVQIFHEGYVAVSDEPTSWIRDSHRSVVANTRETDNKRQEIENDVLTTADVPTPTLIDKVLVDGQEQWQITFPNGWKVYYNDWKKMSPDARRTNTSMKLTGNGLIDGKGNGKGTGKDETPTFFTTTNILIIVGIVIALGVAAFLYFRKRKLAKSVKPPVS